MFELAVVVSCAVADAVVVVVSVAAVVVVVVGLGSLQRSVAQRQVGIDARSLHPLPGCPKATAAALV